MSKNINISKPINIFLSYSTNDKSSAVQYKKSIEYFGLNVFLAHQDIVPSLKWQETILNNLKECDVFVPLISKNFKNSEWTGQESGIAFALEKLILPIRFPVNPYGFLSRFQGLKGYRGLPDYLAELTVQSLIDHKEFKNRLREGLIGSLKIWLKDFDDQRKLEMLYRLNPLSKKQIDSVITRVLENEYLCKDPMPKYIGNVLIIPNRTRISNNILEEFQTRTGWHFND